MGLKTFFACLVVLACTCGCKERNVFTFCRDFNETGCIAPAATTTLTYPIEKSLRTKTIRDFANSIYFRGDRLAFALANADARYAVTFECLHGDYYFPQENRSETVVADAPKKFEIEYLELRENNIYGLVMLGSLIEKKFAAHKAERYRPLPPFRVRYALRCGKAPIAEKEITVQLQ